MVNKGYDQYLRSKIMTASKGELTLMLYEGAIKFVLQNLSLILIQNRYPVQQYQLFAKALDQNI